MVIYIKNIAFASLVTCLAVLTVLLFRYQGVTYWSYVAIFVSALPYKIGRETYISLWGGIVKGNLYSLVGIYQHATGNAVQLFGVCSFQRAGASATEYFGVSLVQIAGEQSNHVFGFALFQKSQDVWQLIGVAGMQFGQTVTQGIGLVCFQRADGCVFQGVGISMVQLSSDYAGQFFGLSLTRHTVTTDQMGGLCLVTYAVDVKQTNFALSPLILSPVRKERSYEE